MISTDLLRSRRTRAGGTRRIGRPGQWDGRRLSPPSNRWLLWLAVALAAGAGALITLGPLKALAGMLALLLLAAVCKWPALVAYLVVVVTPLTAGLGRGGALPVRPNEVFDVLIAVGLAARGLARLRSGRIPRLRLDGVEWAILLMAVFNSVVPLLWMRFRQQPITRDDLLYALVMWKLLGLYAIVRLSVTTDQQIRRCLWLSVAAASVVAVVAILQSLHVLGVSGLVSTYYAYEGNGPATAGARGSSTLALPAATADLMVFNLAIVSGLWIRYRRHRIILASAAVLFVFGALASAEFSSAIGLIIGAVCIAIVTGSPRLLALFIPAGVVGSGVLRSVLAGRLSGFQSPAGLPDSWVSRLSNLRTYFWPKLFSGWNAVLGVRTAARIPVATQNAGYVWIESGYTWLLWGGGIPLLASYAYFVVASVRRGWLAARYSTGAASIAGVAVFVAVLVTAVLMIFDPHLTYRGSGDALFVLIALAAPRRSRHGELSSPAERPNEATIRGDGGSIVTPEDENTGRDKPRAWPSRFSPDGNVRGSRGPAGLRADQDYRMTGVGTGKVRRHPGRPGQLPRFLRAHLVIIVATAVVVTAAVAALARLQTPEYRSQAAVVAFPATTQASNETQANIMGTEQAIAQSGAVITLASQRVHVPESTLRRGLAVTVPANSYLLNISFTGPTRLAAQRNAQAIADAYAAYRTPQLAVPHRSRTTAGAVDATVITAASLPRAPSSPNLALDIGLGVIVGILLGIGFALLRDRMDDRLRGPADLEEQTGAPVVGVVPPMQRGSRDPTTGLAVVHCPGSMAADAFRNLRTRVVQTAAWLDGKTVLVASPAGEEEAVVSGNLAGALALAGRHAVLVCADLRRQRAQGLFGVTGCTGLTNVLDGKADLSSAVQRTDVAGLDILPSGPVSGDPAAVPQSRELPGLLDAIRDQADFVILDAPPVLAGPDTGVLGEFADMVLLVADARRSTRAGVRAAAREMEQIHGMPEGCVLVNAGRRRRIPKLPAAPPGWLRRPRRIPNLPVHWRLPKLPAAPPGWLRRPLRHGLGPDRRTGDQAPAPQRRD